MGGYEISPSNVLVQSDLQGALFQGRVQLVSASTLGLVPFNGSRVLINGERQILPSAGQQLVKTANVISAVGADTGAAMVAGTLYCLYCSDSRATTFPVEMRASTTLPTVGTDGVKRLGAIGSNAASWLFVGAAYLDGAGNFLDVNQTRHVASYYNRTLTRCHRPIGWVDDGAVTVFNLASANYAPIFGGGAIGNDDVLSIVDLGIDDNQVQLDFTIDQTVAAEWSVAISAANITPSSNFPAAVHQDGPVAAGVGRTGVVAYAQRTLGFPGLRTYTACGRSAAAAQLRFRADLARNGASGDPIGCMFSALAMM